MIARRDIIQIVDGMARRWIGQSVLALGDSDGPGGVPFGQKRFSGSFKPGQKFGTIQETIDDDGKHYFDNWKPRGRRIGIGEFALATREGGGFVTLKEGQRIVRLANARLKLALLTGKIGKTLIQRAKDTYRSWQGREIAAVYAKDVLEWADKALILANVHVRKKGKRFKRLSTSRDRKTLPFWWEGKFEFGGKAGAFRLPVGRPPLTHEQWALRYMERRKLQSSNVTVPKCKNGRPENPL